MTGQELKQNVENALDEIRPFLKNDGGDIELLGIEKDEIVKAPQKVDGELVRKVQLHNSRQRITK